MPKFFSTGVTDGLISKTKIRFGSYLYLTNFDDSKITKNVFYSDSNSETRKYFRQLISESKKIIKSEKLTKGKVTSKRILTLSEDDGIKRYELFIYNGGKSFVSISAKKLEILEEFEKYLTSEN